jgi:UDP-N-acetylmuramate--alanine ligase
VKLRLHGRHNALNALAAIAVARELDIPFATTAAALEEFGGADRRMQRIADRGDVLIIDDYGHHPTEIRAVLGAAKDAWGRRTIVCFQPHRYSRSQLLKEEFGRAFYQADAVFVLPIYAAGEAPIPGVSSGELATSIIEHGHKRVTNVDSLEAAVEAMLEIVRPGDVVLTLGAGDVWKVARDLAARLEASPERANDTGSNVAGNGG